MFPLIYLLYTYSFFALLALLFLFFNLYHLAKFGLESMKTYAVIVIYLSLFLSALAISLIALTTIDWSSSLDVKAIFMEIIGTTKPHVTMPTL